MSRAPSATTSPAMIGSYEDAYWSETTLKEAAAPEHKEWLDHGFALTVSGEVVDVSCYLQFGRRGPSHADCARKCVRAGQPGGLVDDDGDVYLLIPEQVHPRRDGQASLKDWIVSNMGRTATVTGLFLEVRGLKALFVRVPTAAPRIQASPSPAPSPPAVR